MKDSSIKLMLEFLINKYFSITTVIFLIYLLYCYIFLLHYSFKKILIAFISVTLIFIIYLTVYDITYVQYLMQLHINETFRTLISHYLPTFSFSKYAPSKAMPTFGKSHFNILQMKYKLFCAKISFKYLKLMERRLLFLARIYSIILSMPERKYVLRRGTIKQMDYCYLYYYERRLAYVK